MQCSYIIYITLLATLQYIVLVFYKTFLWYTSDNRDMCWWEPETNRGEIVESTTYYDMEKDRLILTIHEIEVLAVEGKLKFK